MINLKKFLWIIGFLFMLLYGIYVSGYSTAPIFKYALIIGLFFWSVELLIQIIQYLLSPLKKIQMKN